MLVRALHGPTGSGNVPERQQLIPLAHRIGRGEGVRVFYPNVFRLRIGARRPTFGVLVATIPHRDPSWAGCVGRM